MQSVQWGAAPWGPWQEWPGSGQSRGGSVQELIVGAQGDLQPGSHHHSVHATQDGHMHLAVWMSHVL